MRGFRWVLIASAMAMVNGCLSWSRQTYEANGDEPPVVRHSATQVGMVPARSPMEAASADAIGTSAKYGYGGYYGGYDVPLVGGSAGAFGAPQMQYLSFRPFGAPKSRVIRIENLDDEMVVRMQVNGVAVPGYIAPHAEYFVVSNHPTHHRVEFCAYEAPGGSVLGYWGKSWQTHEGLGQELTRGRFTGGICPF